MPLLSRERSRTIDRSSWLDDARLQTRPFSLSFRGGKEEKRRTEATVCFGSLHEIAIHSLWKCITLAEDVSYERDRATWEELILKVDPRKRGKRRQEEQDSFGIATSLVVVRSCIRS